MADGEACYFPDGSVSPQDMPCHSLFPEDGASACCGAADVCLNNKLCLAQTGAERISEVAAPIRHGTVWSVRKFVPMVILILSTVRPGAAWRIA